jgi:phytoene dehydrogenase-like protein
VGKSVIIIGAGIAGLAAGCYAQMNGYHSQIFEMHDLPGGLCTAWERRGYVFDGCIHYLLGSGPGQPYHRMWEELGALQGRRMIHHDELMRVIGPDGKTLIAYADPDELERHMKMLSPADARLIEGFCGAIRQFAHFDHSAMQAKPRNLMGAGDWAAFGLKMLPFLGPLAKWALVSAEDFAARFSDPFLRRAFPKVFGWPEIPMMAAISILGAMHAGNAAFPAGASLEFARALERRYLALGGEIHYKAQVERILVERQNGKARAAGVRLYSNAEHRADAVISAADGRGTVFGLLDGEFADRRIRRTYDGHLPIYSQFQVSLGVNRDLSAEPHWATYLLDEPALIAGDEQREVGVKHYCFDPSLAPAGKSAVIVMLRTDYDYWQRIYGRRPYDTEQSEVSDQVIDFLERIYPGLRGDIEVVDEATPLSYERYTGNWQGSSTGWLLTTQTMTMNIIGMPKSLPSLADLYLCGQWVEPGGMVPVCAMSGRNAIWLLCHADRRPFVTAMP